MEYYLEFAKYMASNCNLQKSHVLVIDTQANMGDDFRDFNNKTFRVSLFSEETQPDYYKTINPSKTTMVLLRWADGSVSQFQLPSE